MDALYEVQKELQKNVVNSFSNFKKKGAAKMTKIAAQTRLNALEEWYCQLTGNHKKLLMTKDIPRDHEYFVQNLYEQVLDSYFEKKGEFLEFLDDINKRDNPVNPPSVTLAPTEANVRPTTADPYSLPKMNLPKFSGNFSDWENFRDLFRSVVHRRNDLEASIKYYYLRTLLTGEGLEHIKAIPIAADHYERAWNTLVEHYDNKRRTISTLISKMLSVKSMNAESASELKRVSTEIFSPLESLCALGITGEDIGNDLIVHLVVQHFENGTKKDWKMSLDSTTDTPPTIQKLKDFITSQLETLDSLEEKNVSSSSASKGKNSRGKQSKQESEANSVHSLQTVSNDAHAKSVKCILCNGEHTIGKCEEFQRKPLIERREFAKSKRLCFNCLSGAHTKAHCKSRFNCFICRNRHHTLLHMDSAEGTKQTEGRSESKSSSETSHVIVSCSNVVVEQAKASTLHSARAAGGAGVLLATAQVYVIGSNNRRYLLRALIDPGSQVSLMTQSMCNQLGLSQTLTHVCIKGVGENASTFADKLVSFSLAPHFSSNYKTTVEALVLPKLSSYIPPVVAESACFKHLTGLQLADPEYTKSTRVDLLLGASVYAEIVKGGIVRGSNLQPIAIDSKIGWIITGRIPTVAPSDGMAPSSLSVTALHCSCSVAQDSIISDLLQEFWRTEEVEVKNSCTEEERVCEERFVNTTLKDHSGRYVVRLPWKDQTRMQEINLGSSYPHALRALKRLEANFAKDERLRSEYSKFMKEYIELGHMTAVTGEVASEQSDFFFLPHHGVWKETSSTTKLRTVFNASSKLDSGESLNDLLYSGKNLLKHPVDLICVVRNYLIALSADVEKMFRMVGVHEKDRKFQAILWRFSPLDRIIIYLLNTVTYGLTCSSYLAMRALVQMAKDYENEYPIAANVVRDEMYSDNVLTGAHSPIEAKEKINQLIDLFKRAQMNLRKWSSSNREALSHLPKTMLDVDEVTLFTSDKTVPILGISWNARGDFFKFHVEQIVLTVPITKRSMLSRIARIFDPLGWMAPVIILAKIMLQSLWLMKVAWDEVLPDEIATKSKNWLEELPSIEEIKIPRWTGYTPRTQTVEIHGFADASKAAYGAVLYLRLLQDAQSLVSLQVAKSKVAPIKTLSIPRLELCAALLLARLVAQFLGSAKIKIDSVHLWTDSADVIFWLKDHPARWNTFVANRCSEIHTTLPNAFWHHVKSADNPADAVSRGVGPSKLIGLNLWWNGPPFLTSSVKEWPNLEDNLNFCVSSITTAHSYEILCRNADSNQNEEPRIWSLIRNYSSLPKLLGISSYCLRFIARISQTMISRQTKPYQLLRLECFAKSINMQSTHVASHEMHNAKLFWCYLLQAAYFPAERQLLLKNRQLPVKNPLKNLNPYVENHLIKVGGRLNNSLLSDRTKHPIVLPRSTFFNELLIRDAHLLTLHGGTQLTLATIRQRFWIVRGRAEVKAVIGSCVKCVRYAAQTPTQLMGDLPSVRVQMSPPFEKAGVDYAGPISVRLTKTRGKGTLKGYICVFVCMVTRAVHLELAEDYTSEAFIAAFHRFTARRGHCKELYSDRGTNFVGADAQLRQMLVTMKDSTSLAERGTLWKFNPPGAPHFGGLWEAAVKSLKFHIRRVIGDQILTFSELATLLCRVEACLNSRPLVRLSDDPTDLRFLTPAHFLIQRSSYLVPEPDFQEDMVPLGKRWRVITQMLQDFWSRWYSEYLTSLQARTKWLDAKRSLEEGDIVFIRCENAGPGKWPLGRIATIHPGKNALVRVATVQTSSGQLRRPLVKLVLLPKTKHELE